MKKIRVLTVDDSSLVREILREGLSADPEIEVVAVAPDPYIARDKIARFLPDVLTLDVEMPKMDGIQFLRHMMPQFPIPVVMVSALTKRGQQLTLEALEAGAVDFVTKPSVDLYGLEEMMVEIRQKVKLAAKTDVSGWKNRKVTAPQVLKQNKALAVSTHKVIAIGASTGGVEATSRILPQFPADSPGIVLVQHMPPGFTTSYAERLNKMCTMEVKEAENGDHVLPGRVLLAPGLFQMRVYRSGGQYIVKCNEENRANGHCPSVGVLFESVAEHVGSNAVGAILTGMGNDGAEGIKKMRDAGARTIGQNEQTSVVFGMPKVAYESGGVEKLFPLENIPKVILHLLQHPKTNIEAVLS